ncbi:VHS domain-containing protein [Mucor ambiguus]|uniref:VHS domain-containing protein n=1 Tax=Mucor ambiguus TaxID=91626 RepID=A0A0C9M9G0_9FUNG|nr:VHS domain-containing protein [Mucor ambiguus]
MPSTLIAIIEGACSPARYEPELSLNLEICEMINKKQGSAPREAASAIVKLVNSKNLNQAMLALTLLDNCVKNCGYPFHLQIASKEFLNELVRKFPERPAPFPSPVVQRILYFIKEWKVALTDMSRHKDDLVHIKDMYRLLRFKGYRFPELRDSSVAALAPSGSLKSAHELEEEDRVAQSAKLQELIRRGRPQDLVEANRLMKIMSGFDTRQTPDYSQKFEDELHKIQDKAILLYEMLETVKPGDKDLKGACASAQPKIQKMITEEEDNDKIENLLTLNDMINNVMAKFADVKKGLYDTQYEISGKPPTQDTNTTEEPKQAISLIDLDDTPAMSSSTGSASPSINNKSALNELSDLFGSSSISSPAPPSNQQQQPLSAFDLLGTSSFSSPAPQQQQQPKKTNDIFDLLGGGIPNNPSPLTSHSEIASPSISNINVPSQTRQQQTPSPVFSSSQDTHVESAILVNKNGLQIELQMKNPQESVCQIKAYFSNQSTAPMEKLMLRLAAPKSMQIKMEPQSSQIIPPKSDKSVTQGIVLNNPNKEPLRLRYKVSYEQFGVEMELTGDYHA